ncbi:KEOPS complex subunit Cgi121 [Natronomonas sp. EA1]|uniref:KEOPS complex subunit Cgi121 n=1 Tax=Natronomonas sp. EA1 TaxID=3421655 RepID=UPI003EBD3CBF
MALVEGVATVTDVGAFVATLADIEDETGATVQAFDARYVVGEEHLAFALELADRERERGHAIARDRGMEVLLYAAGRRQIDRALTMGVAAGETPVVVLVDGGDEAAAVAAVEDLLTPAETLGAYDEDRVCDYFGISETEREATAAPLGALVRERVALLVVER